MFYVIITILVIGGGEPELVGEYKVQPAFRSAQACEEGLWPTIDAAQEMIKERDPNRFHTVSARCQ